jgi:hypothetical protein
MLPFLCTVKKPVRGIFSELQRLQYIFRVNEVVEPDLSAGSASYGRPSGRSRVLPPSTRQARDRRCGRIFQRAGVADGHDEILPLQPRPLQGPAFHQIHADGWVFLQKIAIEQRIRGDSNIGIIDHIPEDRDRNSRLRGPESDEDAQ